MTLANRLLALEEASEFTPCKVRSILDSLDDETASVLLKVLKGKLSNHTIAKELCESGYAIGRTTVGTHRAGRCSCGATK